MVGGVDRGDPTTTAVGPNAPIKYTPLHAAVVVPSEHANGPAGDRETERFIASEMLRLCDTPGRTSTRVNLEAFLQDLIDDKTDMYEEMYDRYYRRNRGRVLFTVDVGYEEGPIFSPNDNRLLLLYRSGGAPVLGAHLVNFLVESRIDRRDYLYSDQMPIYAEDASTTGDDPDERCRLPIPKLLTVDLVEEIRQRVGDVTEIWLQFPTDRAPFLIVTNRHNQYDYIFGEQSDSTLGTPRSHATTLRFQSHACDEARASNGTCGPTLYQCEEGEYYGRASGYKRGLRESYLDHLYDRFVNGGSDEARRRCQRQLANSGSGFIHCDECANASAVDGGQFYYVQYAPLTSAGQCPIARYVLCALSKWYYGSSSYNLYFGYGSEFDLTTPVVHDIRMAFHKRRVLHKVLAVDAVKKGAEPAPGTTSFAAVMGRTYGTRHRLHGHLPFASVDDCLQSPEYKTNKMLHHFAKGFNETTGRPAPEWGGEGDMDWRRRVCQSLSPTTPT